MDHPEWDLTAYSVEDSNFWEVESLATKETPGEGVVRETVVVVIDPSS